MRPDLGRRSYGPERWLLGLFFAATSGRINAAEELGQFWSTAPDDRDLPGSTAHAAAHNKVPESVRSPFAGCNQGRQIEPRMTVALPAVGTDRPAMLVNLLEGVDREHAGTVRTCRPSRPFSSATSPLLDACISGRIRHFRRQTRAPAGHTVRSSNLGAHRWPERSRLI